MTNINGERYLQNKGMTRFIIKCDYKSAGVVYLGRVRFPARMIGKKVRFYVEVEDDVDAM